MSLLHQSNDGPGRIVDLFAGPGGWSEGLKALGFSELGVEWDEAACLTARAAGHERLQADVAAIDPIPCWGLIASPPCQAWSMAGKGGGRRDKELCVRAALELAAGNDTRAERAKECEDERSMLVVEPLRWALATRPEWIAMEQVPPVLEMWTLFAQILRQAGYSVWSGVLEAERYGVPQTRERAILMASRVSEVHPPVATHQRYVKGEPQRHDLTMEGEVLPWVSMAEALGWAEGTGAYKLARGEGMEERHGQLRAVPDVEPAPVITSKARTADWILRTGMNTMSVSRDAQDMQPYERPVSVPAPTVDGKVGTAWKVAPDGEHKDAPQKWKLRAGTNANDIARPADEPAPTMRFGARSNDVSWVDGRSPEFHRGPVPVSEPAPTIASTTRQAEIAAVRVTVAQASVLQSFRPDYPWQGSRTKQFEQVGNAVPPKLAQAVLAALIPTAQEASRVA